MYTSPMNILFPGLVTPGSTKKSIEPNVAVGLPCKLSALFQQLNACVGEKSRLSHLVLLRNHDTGPEDHDNTVDSYYSLNPRTLRAIR